MVEEEQQYDDGEAEYMGQSSHHDYGQNIHIPPPAPIAYQQQQVNQKPIASSGYNMIPLPQPINPPFIPRQVTPARGPIITIPPMRAQYNPTIIYPTSTIPLMYQNRNVPQQTFDHRQNAFSSELIGVNAHIGRLESNKVEVQGSNVPGYQQGQQLKSRQQSM